MGPDVLPVLVTASVEVTGITEAKLVGDKTMQAGFIMGFSTATSIDEALISIVAIGSTQLNARRLADKLVIEFQIKADSAIAAESLKEQVVSTPADKITQGIVAAGVTGVKASTAPSASILKANPTPSPTMAGYQPKWDDDNNTVLIIVVVM